MNQGERKGIDVPLNDLRRAIEEGDVDAAAIALAAISALTTLDEERQERAQAADSLRVIRDGCNVQDICFMISGWLICHGMNVVVDPTK